MNANSNVSPGTSSTPPSSPSSPSPASAEQRDDAAGKQGYDAGLALASQVKSSASDLTDQAKQAAGDVLGQAKKSAETKLSGSKERAAESLGDVADALRRAGEHLRSQDKADLNDYVVRAADKVEAASFYLQRRTLSDVVGDVSGFARREPALFLGGAFALGLLGGRFLKSSGSPLATQSGSGNGGAGAKVPGAM